jgi:putative glutamine amidotransferase
MKAVVGVAAWTTVISHVPVDLPQQAIADNYLDALRTVGLTPIVIPVSSDPDTASDVLDRVDGLVLTGGCDVAPASYGALQEPKTITVDARRDAVEIELVRLARQRDMPVLAICRGLQVANVALGGTLIQDLPTANPPRPGHRVVEAWDGPAHLIHMERTSQLYELLGPEIMVNSLHHQGIAALAPGLRAVGHAPDGLIEAAEDPGARFLVGVQWHPEMLGPQHPSSALFRQFALAARDRSRPERRTVGHESRTAVR